MLGQSQRFTALGLSSLLIWASLVGVVKLISEQLSPVLALALIYSVSALVILLPQGWPKLSQMPKIYLWGGGALFVSYEILFLLSIALSTQREQVLMIAMINYLWPPLSIVLAILAKQLRYHWAVIPGFVLAVLGLMLVVNPEIWNLVQLWSVLTENPLAYSLAFSAALLWPCYGVLTRAYAQGSNAVSLFFVVTAALLWALHVGLDEPWQWPDLSLWGWIVLAGALIGMAYHNWNQSIQFGRIQLLILATYFIPVLSSLISMWLLQLQPGWVFWLGCSLVSLGALICWKSTSEISA